MAKTDALTRAALRRMILSGRKGIFANAEQERTWKRFQDDLLPKYLEHVRSGRVAILDDTGQRIDPKTVVRFVDILDGTIELSDGRLVHCTLRELNA
jgi:hypothetical protein